jgi:hypothetical protein
MNPSPKILYIKATVFVCLCGQCLEDSSNHCLFPVVSVCGDKQGRVGQDGQGSRCGGPGEVPFLLKKSLGETGDLHQIKQTWKPQHMDVN